MYPTHGRVDVYVYIYMYIKKRKGKKETKPARRLHLYDDGQRRREDTHDARNTKK